MFLGLTPAGIPVLSAERVHNIMGANPFMCRDPELEERLRKVGDR